MAGSTTIERQAPFLREGAPLSLTGRAHKCRECEHWVLDFDLGTEFCVFGNQPKFYIVPGSPIEEPRRVCGLFKPTPPDPEDQ